MSVMENFRRGRCRGEQIPVTAQRVRHGDLLRRSPARSRCSPTVAATGQRRKSAIRPKDLPLPTLPPVCCSRHRGSHVQESLQEFLESSARDGANT